MVVRQLDWLPASTMTQHIMVNEISRKPVGRVLFGLPTDLAQL